MTGRWERADIACGECGKVVTPDNYTQRYCPPCGKIVFKRNNLKSSREFRKQNPNYHKEYNRKRREAQYGASFPASHPSAPAGVYQDGRLLKF